MPSINDHFSENMTGKTVSFDIQPYMRGRGIIKKCIPRRVLSKMHSPYNGMMLVEYECFDLLIECESGSSTGAFYGGVPVTGSITDLTGKETNIIGVRYGQLHDAVFENETIVIARCG